MYLKTYIMLKYCWSCKGLYLHSHIQNTLAMYYYYCTEKLQKLKMYTHILLTLGRLNLSNMWNTHTHTHTLSLSLSLPIHTYTFFVTRHHEQNTWIETWRFFSSGVHHRSTQENLLLLLHSSMLLNREEGSPVVLPCLPALRFPSKSTWQFHKMSL